MHLGKSLKIALAIKGMKNKDIAEGLEVDPSQVSNWIKNGTISNHNLVRICSLLKMAVSEFVALSE